MIQIDDLWLASYLVTQGAELAGVQVLPYHNGKNRLRAVFELQGVKPQAIESYAGSDPAVKIHQLRTAMNRLRDLMYEALEKRNGGNGSIKQMPNGKGRRGEHETATGRHR